LGPKKYNYLRLSTLLDFRSLFEEGEHDDANGDLQEGYIIFRGMLRVETKNISKNRKAARSE
jgi:hypothetical protein